ncbi:helix-turn-helix transcriptional regulator [Nocardia sp. NPDC057353]|uniref:helix-turn-helix transcriptional regulator n=1 Tax=Nocardia sp. NPDC057353 TaxID=3346104 RepID=UPI00363FECE4
MQTLAFHSDDLGATEEFLTAAYVKMSIGNGGDGPASAAITRDSVGGVSLDRLALGFEMRYDADPLGKICLCTVESGAVEETRHATAPIGPGEVGLLTPPDRPYSGTVHRARFGITMFDPALLDRVAANAPGSGGEPVRITGHRPVSARAGGHLVAVIHHLRELARDPAVLADPLVGSVAADYLAASVLNALPNTAAVEPTAADRADAHPDTVRRAVAFMESELRRDIAATDIAAAAFVSLRALQLAFRKHLGTTPMVYLRQLRLRGAHEELRRATPGSGATVTAIAASWGFGHPGRFAAAYRSLYGRSPQVTLYS